MRHERGRLHLLGLVSDGGVHSGWEHLEAIIELVGDSRRRFLLAAAARERALAYDVAQEALELLARYAALVDATAREPTPCAA